jgi:hypothetical protein
MPAFLSDPTFMGPIFCVLLVGLIWSVMKKLTKF